MSAAPPLDRSFDDAQAIAVEHVRWCRASGIAPSAIFAALETAAPPHPSWDDATRLVALRAHETSMERHP